MTIIAAAYNGPTNYALAADSHSVANGLRRACTKTARLSGGWLVGTAGNHVEGVALVDLLRAANVIDAPTVRRAFVEVVGYAWMRAAGISGLDSHMLFVGPAGIWTLGSDGGWTRAPNRWAVGSGEHVGVGAMYGREGEPADVVRLAVEAACALADGCFGEAVVVLGEG